MKSSIFPGWWQVAAALIVQGISAVSVYTAYSIIATPLQLAFSPSRMVLMLSVSLATLASTLLGPVIGPAIDRYSIRLIMLGGAGSLVAGFFLLSFASTMNQVLVVYLVLMSLGALVLGPVSASALLSRWFSRRRGLALSIAASGIPIFGLIVPSALQALIELFEWRIALRLFSMIIFILTVPTIALLVIDRPADRGLYPDGIKPADDEPVRKTQVQFDSAGALLRNRNFWLIAIVLGVIYGPPAGIVSNLVQFAADRGIDASLGAILISVSAGAGLFGKLICAAISDRIDFRILLVSVLVLFTIGAFGLLFTSNYVVMLVCRAIMGTATGGAVPLWGLIVATVFGPERVGRVMGLMTLIVMPFALVSPPFFGWVFDLTGSYDKAFVSVIVLCVLVMFLPMRIRADRAAPVRQNLTA